MVNVGSTSVSPASVITVASAEPVPSGLNTARWWRSAATSREKPTMPLMLSITAAKTVSRASVAPCTGSPTIRVTISATSITVTATARISEPIGSPTRWATTSAWWTAASTAPTRNTATAVTPNGPSGWVTQATASATRAAGGTSVVQRLTAQTLGEAEGFRRSRPDGVRWGVRPPSQRPVRSTRVSASVFPRLEPRLPSVSKPIQYVGGELNSTVKDWDVASTVRWALMYPDAYEVGLPNQGVQILYEVLNERDWILAERIYAVWPDMEAVMRERRHPAVHRRRPPTGRATSTCFGISFSTELGYTNLLNALDLAGIPLHAVDRGDDDPIVLAGGHAAFNPEPIADFVDAAVLGDGEEIVLAISEVVREWKAEGRPGRSRRAAAAAGASRQSVYVPEVLRRRLRRRRPIEAVVPNRPGIPFRVRKHTLMDLDAWPYPAKPLVPLAETVHERFSVEIFRGCTRGCRFCQAGMITRPVRERSIETIGDDGRERHPQVRLRGGRPALAVERRPLRDRRGRQGPGRPLRGHQRLALAAQHPGRRLQHHPGQRVLPQRPPLRADLRPRGRHASGCAR